MCVSGRVQAQVLFGAKSYSTFKEVCEAQNSKIEVDTDARRMELFKAVGAAKVQASKIALMQLNGLLKLSRGKYRSDALEAALLQVRGQQPPVARLRPGATSFVDHVSRAAETMAAARKGQAIQPTAYSQPIRRGASAAKGWRAGGLPGLLVPKLKGQATPAGQEAVFALRPGALDPQGLHTGEQAWW